MKIAKVKTQTEYTSFAGGLDQESPPFKISPGALIDGINYVPSAKGGYRRIDGYERYDGHTSPSDATYYSCIATVTGAVEVGDTITGSTSGATGYVITVGTGYINVTKVTGTFEVEAFTVGGVEQGSITAVPGVAGENTGIGNATALSLAADLYRLDISAPTGSGPVRGLGLLRGVLYCFIDNALGTAGLIYKATTAGWVNVPLFHEISFDTGLATIADGTAISQVTSGATAVVKRTVHESGTWGSTAAGRLILSSIVGTFNATDEIQVAAATKMTSTSLATAISILPGGRYETIEYNFTASLLTKRMYGADGVNRGFEFDGVTYIPLNTGMPTDTPEYVYGHKSQLFFSFNSSSQNSGIGTPYQWTAVSGSLEIGMGDNITGYAGLPGAALGILARNSSDQLIGNSVDDYVKSPISTEVGAIPRTVQNLGYAYCLDDRGVIKIYPTQAYGNFDQSTISRLVQPIIDSMRKVVIASSVYRARNQYRLYGSDGTGICMTVLDKGVAYGKFEYPVNVACAVTGEDTTGKDVVFFGSDDGMVYQADRGSSFDGEEIEAFVFTPFNNSRQPSYLKSYRKATLEMTSDLYSEIRVSTDFSYSDPAISEAVSNSLSIHGKGALWDTADWDDFYYDMALIEIPSFKINGAGTNIALIIYSKSKTDLGHKIDGSTIHYTIRRITR